jgi:hypothetical protein
MKFLSTIVMAALVVGLSSAFQQFHLPISTTTPTRQASQLFADPQQLTEYMAKAHEEKLRAVKLIEEKKNAEIEVRDVELLYFVRHRPSL